MNRDSKRLLLELEPVRRAINREIINPEIQELAMDRLRPIVTMVAEVRAAYIKSLFDLAENRDGIPTQAQIAELREQRLAFDELVNATNALETAITRDYIDVVDSRKL